MGNTADCSKGKREVSKHHLREDRMYGAHQKGKSINLEIWKSNKYQNSNSLRGVLQEDGKLDTLIRRHIETVKVAFEKLIKVLKRGKIYLETKQTLLNFYVISVNAWQYIQWWKRSVGCQTFGSSEGFWA